MYRFFVVFFVLIFIVACNTSTPKIPNNVPVVEGIKLSTQVDTAITISFSGSDADGDSLSYEVSSQPTNGTVGAVNVDKIIYTPDANFSGQDSFEYVAKDGKSSSVSAEVQIQVVKNNLPVVEALKVSTLVDTIVTISFSGSDADGDSIDYEVLSGPLKGTLGVINENKVVYTPNSGFVGQDSFTYAARDALGAGTAAEVQIQVIRSNTKPQINKQSFSIQENKAVNTVVANVAATDADGDDLRYEIISGNSQNTFKINADSGELRLASVPNFEAVNSYALQVKVTDTGGLTSTATVTVQIANVDYGKVIFAGDSITRGWDGVGGRNVSGVAWPLKVQTALSGSFAGDFTTQNSGIDGDTAIGLKNRLASQVLSQNPRFVTVQIGTNDVYNNGGIATASPTVAGYEAQIAAILQNLKATGSIKQVFVLGIISPIKSRSDVVFPGLIQIPQAQLDSQVAAFNAALLRQSQQRGFVFINLAAQFPADAASRLAWLPDGVHPSEAGYNRIASLVEAQLRANFN